LSGHAKKTWVNSELAGAGVTDTAEANCFLLDVYCLPSTPSSCNLPYKGSAFIPYTGKDLADILYEQYERTVRNDNCVEFEKLTLQIPADHARLHYVKVKVRMHCSPDRKPAIFHGPRCLDDTIKVGHFWNQAINQNHYFVATGSIRTRPLNANPFWYYCWSQH
jgi:hypothetical protein